jgi:hypothetical protein
VLSSLLGSIDGYQIGQHPLVARLLKGVSHLRPPSCKYNYTWDASLILSLFASWGKNSELDIKRLTHKTVALLALRSAQRVQTLMCITTNIVHFLPTEVVIRICNRLKTSKPGEGLIINLKKFSKPNLCVYSRLQEYLKVTKTLRSSPNLFICTNSPHKSASPQTVSRWLKEVLNLSGIDVSWFSSHSFRHSSTSISYKGGLCLDTIYKAAGWSSKSKVFAKYYNKPIFGDDFATAVLKGV